MSQTASIAATGIDWPSHLRIATTQNNPRSTSGLLIDKSDPTGPRLYYKRSPTSEACQREATELQRAAIATRCMEDVQPVRLHACLPDHRILITEYVADGQSMFNYLWNGTRWWERAGSMQSTAADAAARLGSWLQQYHASSLCPSQPALPIVRIVTGEIRDKLDVVVRESSLLPPATASAIGNYLGQLERRFEHDNTQSTAQIHGDLALANLLIAPSHRLNVLDFGDTRIGFPREDLVRAWHDIWAISELSRHRKRLLNPCLLALLDSYGLSQSDVEDPLFVMLRCWNAVCNISTAIKVGRRIGFTAGVAIRRMARVNARWLNTVDWTVVLERS